MSSLREYEPGELERLKDAKNLRRINFSCVGEEHEDFINELGDFVSKDD